MALVCFGVKGGQQSSFISKGKIRHGRTIHRKLSPSRRGTVPAHTPGQWFGRRLFWFNPVPRTPHGERPTPGRSALFRLSQEVGHSGLRARGTNRRPLQTIRTPTRSGSRPLTEPGAVLALGPSSGPGYFVFRLNVIGLRTIVVVVIHLRCVFSLRMKRCYFSHAKTLLLKIKRTKLLCPYFFLTS